MRRADVEKIKAFASRTHDRARPAYGRRRFDAPRRCIFIATTNEDQYLQSQTGNRRFWPVKTGAIDIESLARDRDHLWAEAAYAEAKGNLLVLPAELWKAASAAQEQRRLEDPWDDILTSILAALPGGIYASDADSDEERITTAELFKALEVPATRAQAVEAQQARYAAAGLGRS
jgi:predicted P-loop ATPase